MADQQTQEDLGYTKTGLSAYQTASRLSGAGNSAGVGDALAGIGLYQGLQQGGTVGDLQAATSAAKLAGAANTALNTAGVATGAAGDALGAVSSAAGYVAAPLAVYEAITQFKPGATAGDTLRGAEAGAAIGSIVPGIGNVIGGVIGGLVGAASSLFGHTDTTAASWQEMSEGGGQASFAANPNALMSAVGGLQRSPDLKFSGDTDFGGDGNKFSTALAQQVASAVQSGKISATATPQQIFTQVAQPWLQSLPGGWTQVDPKDPNRARVAAGEQEMVTDLISNYQQGKAITSFQVAGQAVPAAYQVVPAFSSIAASAPPPSVAMQVGNAATGQPPATASASQSSPAQSPPAAVAASLPTVQGPYSPSTSQYNPNGAPTSSVAPQTYGYSPSLGTVTPSTGAPASSSSSPLSSFLPAAALGATALGGISGSNNNMALDPSQGTIVDPAAATANNGNVASGVATGNTILGGLGSVLGTLGNVQAANTSGNVLSLANAGTGVGTAYGYQGPNTYGSYQNGQVSTGLTGALTNTNNGLQNFANTSTGQAATAANGLPTNVANALQYQTNLTNQLPQGTQGQLQQQSNLQNGVQNSQLGLINAGNTQLNNPLTQQYQSAAGTQLGTAGQSFTNTYNTQLAALNQSLALPTAQAESQLADQQFGRGQLGTSGGALQTQAFATGLGQAYLGNQQTAYNEAMNAQNSATSNAVNLGNAANSNLSTANGLLSNAFSQFNNTSALNTNTANSIYQQNQAINQLGNQYGQQNLNNQVTAAGLPASYASQYLANANNAVAGTTALNNQALSGFNAAITAGTQQGNQYNNAIGNASKALGVANTTTGTNSLGSLGSLLTGAGGNNVLGGLSGLAGIGGSSLNNFGTSQTGAADTSGIQQGAIDATAPSFDFSGIGTTYDPSQFDDIWGS